MLVRDADSAKNLIQKYSAQSTIYNTHFRGPKCWWHSLPVRFTMSAINYSTRGWRDPKEPKWTLECAAGYDISTMYSAKSHRTKYPLLITPLSLESLGHFSTLVASQYLNDKTCPTLSNCLLPQNVMTHESFQQCFERTGDARLRLLAG